MKIPECLENISPQWYEVLQNHGFEQIIGNAFLKTDVNEMVDPDLFDKDDTLDINQSHCCIVGEAWGFDRYGKIQDHECRHCEKLSMEFFYIFGEDTQQSYTLEECVTEFCNHVKQEHPELIKDRC